MNKDEFKASIFEDNESTQVNLPVCYWKTVLNLLEKECASASYKMSQMSEFEVSSKVDDEEFQNEFSLPFIILALIVDSLVENEVMPVAVAEGRDLDWLLSMKRDPDSLDLMQ